MAPCSASSPAPTSTAPCNCSPAAPRPLAIELNPFTIPALDAFPGTEHDCPDLRSHVGSWMPDKHRPDRPKGSTLILTLLMMAASLLSSCGPYEPVALLLPAPGLAIDSPERGPYGVALLERDLRVRVDQRVRTLIYLPTGEQAEEQAHPLALLLQGGAVNPEQYGWLALHLASRGYVVLSPDHPLDFAIFATGNGADVITAARDAATREGDVLEGRIAPEPGLALGHSLGGVVASKVWLRRPGDLSHLFLLQSTPDPADAEQLQQPRDPADRVLAVAGERDGRISFVEIDASLTDFANPVPLAIVQGANHFQMIDSPTASQLESDLAATIPTPQARARVLAALDLLVFDHLGLSPRDPSPLDNPESWPEGLIAP
ncbi:hypothetical protein DV096_17005 [Bradymonadaceae bacterium TMQ3]|nr:hypothetical protein DV096_17005 [Bradymonadaceae bacterium TMQ3]TXC69408.1 hypothetical protein FRC91_17585 [Bradymonadales bacterium TMQ1]